MSYTYGASSSRPGAPYGPAAPAPGRSNMSVCSSIDRYTRSELEEELDLLPPPPEWMLAPAAALPLPPPPALSAVAPARNVVLPSFRPTRPAAWFAAVEDVFRLRGVSDQRDMFAFAYAKLEEAQMQQVDDILEMRPLPPDAFSRLRDRLVSTHSLDAYQRLDQLLALPALGGQRPTSLLATMLQLCPPGEEATMFFRGAFLQRLPSIIRMQLAEDRFSPVQMLATRADALMVHHQTSFAAAVSQQDPADLGGRPPPKKQSAQARPKRPWEKMAICRLHYRYGAAATRCEAPCSFVAEN